MRSLLALPTERPARLVEHNRHLILGRMMEMPAQRQAGVHPLLRVEMPIKVALTRGNCAATKCLGLKVTTNQVVRPLPGDGQ